MPTAQSIASHTLRPLPLLLLAATLGCSTTALVNPEPVAPARTPGRTEAAILRAVWYSHWTVESQKPGEVVARLARGSWEMVVAIDYGEQISIRYVSSHNLDYDGSSHPPRIHAGYNKRVKRLMETIEHEVVLADMSPH